jgi:hypothetical protein
LLKGERVRLTCVHVLVACSGVQGVRDKSGITEFLDSSKKGGLSPLAAYSSFLNGLQPCSNKKIPLKEYFDRAESLLELQSAWIAIWDKVAINYCSSNANPC